MGRDMSSSAVTSVRPPSERAYRLARALSAAIFNGYLRTYISGQEHLPAPGVATIVTANHTSTLDLFVAGYALGRPGHFVAKAELFSIPVFGWFLRQVGAIPARRDRRDLDVLRRLLRVLETGGLVGLAPEGTRSRDGRLGPFDPGFAWLAARTGAQVVPCAIHGAHQLMPKGSRWPRRGTLWVRFGQAVEFAAGCPQVASASDRGALQAFADDIRERTAHLLCQLAAESGVALPGPRPN